MAKFGTHIENIKRHLNNGRSITSWDAIQLYHCTRLSAVIYSLKERHDMLIASETITSEDGARFSRYWQVAYPDSKKAIKDYLLQGNSIDTKLAQDKFYCDHLAVVIDELRKEGMNINKTLIDNEKGCSVNVYRFNK